MSEKGFDLLKVIKEYSAGRRAHQEAEAQRVVDEQAGKLSQLLISIRDGEKFPVDYNHTYAGGFKRTVKIDAGDGDEGSTRLKTCYSGRKHSHIIIVEMGSGGDLVAIRAKEVEGYSESGILSHAGVPEVESPEQKKGFLETAIHDVVVCQDKF